MIEARVPIVEYVSPGGAAWYDDQGVGWMLAIEPLRADAGSRVLGEIAVERLRARVTELEELCLEANCRLAERRQMMEMVVGSLSADLDVALQVVAALAAERDVLAGLLREAVP